MRVCVWVCAQACLHACLIMSCVKMECVHLCFCIFVFVCMYVCVFACVFVYVFVHVWHVHSSCRESRQPGRGIDISSNVEQNKSSLKSFPFGKGSVLRELKHGRGVDCNVYTYL